MADILIRDFPNELLEKGANIRICPNGSVYSIKKELKDGKNIITGHKSLNARVLRVSGIKIEVING